MANHMYSVHILYVPVPPSGGGGGGGGGAPDGPMNRIYVHTL